MFDGVRNLPRELEEFLLGDRFDAALDGLLGVSDDVEHQVRGVDLGIGIALGYDQVTEVFGDLVGSDHSNLGFHCTLASKGDVVVATEFEEVFYGVVVLVTLSPKVIRFIDGGKYLRSFVLPRFSCSVVLKKDSDVWMRFQPIGSSNSAGLAL